MNKYRSLSLQQDVEAVVPLRHQSRAWCWCMCLGLALMLSGVVVGGAYLYRYYVLEVRSQSQQGWGSPEVNGRIKKKRKDLDEENEDFTNQI